MAPGRVAVVVEGRELTVSNLDKVLYPEAAFTKAEVIDYYVRVAPALLPHLGDRGLTLKRFPDGVNAPGFFEKRCPGHRPEWVETAPGPGDRAGPIGYCVLNSAAALAWAANLAALELHAPLARCGDIESPTMVVFDLDPGPGRAMAACCEVALAVREVVGELGLVCTAKTSGSKGLQVYLPLNRPHSHDHTSSFALAVAQLLERRRPDLVVTTQAREARREKVLIDWSQNSRHKTTIGVYSLRARPRPTVSTPVTWDEVAEGVEGAPLSFEAAEVLDRIDRLGDLFSSALTVHQDLPAPRR